MRAGWEGGVLREGVGGGEEGRVGGGMTGPQLCRQGLLFSHLVMNQVLKHIWRNRSDII